MSRKQINISGYLVRQFGAEFRSENWRFDCPLCGADRQRFTVSTVKQVVHCWKCDYTNSLLGFVGDIESVSLSDAFRIISKYKIVKTERKNITRNKIKTPRITRSIDSFRLFTSIQQPSKVESIGFRYLKKRGLSARDIRFWSLGLTDELPGHIISPIIENNRVIYYIARKFLGAGPKYNNPSLEEWGVGKSELLYNYNVALKRAHKGINIVEGVYDVYATGKSSIALLGKVPSEFQLSKIIMMNPSSINIMLDSGDEEKDCAFEIANRLGDLFPIKITLYKSGDPAENQVANSNKEEVQYTFRNLIRNKMKTTRQ